MKLAHSYSAIKQFEDCPQRYYRQRILKDVKDMGGTASIYGDRIHKLLEARLKGADIDQEVERYEPLCRAIINSAEGGELHVEYEMVLTEGMTPTTWWAQDAWLRSKLDVLIVRGHNAVVMDWKTGKRRPDFFQMEMFAAQVFKLFPAVQHVTTSLLWLKDLEQDTRKYTRLDMPALWGDILARIRRIEQAAETNNWPARPSGLCAYCPARQSCKFAR
jgi:RecB family exonuclease